MEDEELLSVSRDSIEVEKWYLQKHMIFVIGIILGLILCLCVSAIINLTVDPDLRTIFLIWQGVPIKVWISVVFLILFLITIYYFKLNKNV